MIFKPDIKNKIAEIIKVENTKDWDIYDKEDNLYLVHYNKNSNFQLFGHIRGLIVDIDNEKVIANSFGYSNTFVTNNIEICDDKFKLGEDNIFDLNRSSFKIGYDGAIIRIFKYNNKVYHSTHKKINGNKAYWGDSKNPNNTFKQMYDNLGGPSDDEIFNPDIESSPYCHLFIIVHPDIVIASKQDIGSGYLVYLGHNKLWDSEDTQILNTKNLDNLSEDFDKSSQFKIIKPKSIDIDYVNHHLKFGYMPKDIFLSPNIDTRLLPGEFVILHYDSKLIRINSISYNWRSEIRGNNPNVLKQYYKLLDVVTRYTLYSSKPSYDYKLKFPSIFLDENTFNKFYRLSYNNTNYNLDKSPLNNYYDILSSILSNSYDWIDDKKKIIFNMWICFYLSLPLHFQDNIFKCYSNYHFTCNYLTHCFLYLHYNKLIPLENNNNKLVINRINNIIIQSRKYTRNKVSYSSYGSYGHNTNYKNIIKKSIKYLLYRERPFNIYLIMDSIRMGEIRPLNVENVKPFNKFHRFDIK